MYYSILIWSNDHIALLVSKDSFALILSNDHFALGLHLLIYFMAEPDFERC